MELSQQLSRYGCSPAFQTGLGIPPGSRIEFAPLAQGEYNVNYLFTHPVNGKKLVLRLNIASQMHLENQIEYEYRSLRFLEASGCTPRVYYVDTARALLPYGALVMEYLPGRPLDYHTDLGLAARCLARIHSLTPPEQTHFIRPQDTLGAMLDECGQMASVYLESPAGDPKTKAAIRRLLNIAAALPQRGTQRPPRRCVANTELNSGNFLINGCQGPNYIIDWEKPILSEPAQDLAHFLAPTSTFWKTDVILSPAEMEAFVRDYRLAAERTDLTGLEERLRLFLTMTCLRGISWCAMAFVEYQNPAKKIQNEFARRKIQEYLTAAFLERVEAEYFSC